MTHHFVEQDCRMFLFIQGAFDAEESQKLTTDIDNFINCDARALNIDLYESDFIDSSGLGLLVYSFKRLREQGRDCTLSGVHGQPHTFLTTLRIDKAITILDENGFNIAFRNQEKGQRHEI